jgi:endonuclease-3
LVHRNAFELLVATILSAQCTDVRVNMVTPQLFAAYPNAKAMATAKLPDIEKLIKSTGFYRNKAKAIKEASQAIVEQHAGQVPDTMEALLTLTGVARKTANVVLGNAFNKNEGMVVDTHIARLSQRLGFSTHKAPKKIEQDLMAIFPRKSWTLLSHLLIFHGRAICKARTPLCQQCPLLPNCPQIGVVTKKTTREKK